MGYPAQPIVVEQQKRVAFPHFCAMHGLTIHIWETAVLPGHPDRYIVTLRHGEENDLVHMLSKCERSGQIRGHDTVFRGHTMFVALNLLLHNVINKPFAVIRRDDMGQDRYVEIAPAAVFYALKSVGFEKGQLTINSDTEA